MTIEKRLELALKISENIKDGKICSNNLYDLQLHLSDALEQVEKLTIPDVVGRSEQLPYDYSEEIRNCQDCKILPSLCALHDK